MKKKIFITATNTNIGKTYTSVKLLEHLGKSGVKIGAFKPIETGVDNIPQDANKLLKICKKYNKNFKDLTPFDITAYTFKLPAAPYSADINSTIDISKIKDKIMQLELLCDFLLIEGAGGLMVPILKDYFMLDLIKDLNIDTLLVTPSHLGCINETLLSINTLKSSNVEFDWCVNIHNDKESFAKVTKPFYDSYFKEWKSLDSYIQSVSGILI
jgi:dethiobiotin synthetase